MSSTMVRATFGDPVVKDETAQTPVPIPTPTWYTASADGAAVSPPHRQVRKGDPIPGGYAAEREFHLSWSMLTGAIAPTPSPGGMGSKGVDVVQVRGYHVYVGSLPMPAEGQPVPVPTVPTVPSVTLTTPDKDTALDGYYVPAPPPTPPAPQALPIWTRIAPSTAYAIQIQAIGLDGTLGPKSAVLNIQTPSPLPPVAYGQAAPLATPGMLEFQQGTAAPSPASNLGIWHLQFNAVHGAASYQIFGNANPRPAMSPTIGLLEGDQLLGTVAQPPVVDSQAPVKFSADNPFKAGARVELKVRAVRPEQLGGNSFSAFAGSLMTVLPRTAKPAQPTSLRLASSATATTVPVTWNMDTPVTPRVAEYRLYESGVFRMKVAAPATAATVGGYQPSSTYKLTVTAVSTEGESYPSSVLEGTTAPA
ncbi:fibronectin type III domain-containing protein [Streptomyces sp. NPDC058525]|uniref:fibronectin type III domain-containing protein n=1 Tax=Streptomyces sp. NPDC058525 TaxID=3346538 RepID=UPI00364920D6